ncbi:MAG: GyrI-like domain-containing protein [Rhodobacteraceae bacterium]|nr:GyrI-like domain-containing protein [Paracoccaceae bacterium]
MDNLDFKKRDKPLYSGKPGRWDRLEVPPITYVASSGQGDPDQPAFSRSVAALYPLAYGIRALCKAQGAVFTVPPLAALWRADDPKAFATGDRMAWQWTVLLRLPDTIDQQMLETVRATALKKLARKKDVGTDSDTMNAVSLINLDEGDCLQTLHLGPYADEAPVLADLHNRVMPELGVTFNGAHHEISLGDPRRAAPEKLRTILRQPVRPA